MIDTPHEAAAAAEPMEEVQPKGLGIISASGPFLIQLGIPLPTDQVTTQGYLKDAGVFAAIHQLLLLPDSYTICALYDRGLGRVWDIGVESADIPVVDEGSNVPHLVPWYQRCEDGTTKLLEIKVEMPRPQPSIEQVMRELGFASHSETEEEGA